MNRKFERHKMTGTRILNIYNGMIGRCYRRTNPNFGDYGGRNIKVCKRWYDSFAAFYKDMGEPPSRDHTLDRYPDNNGDYKPDNCRWATKKEQARNTRRNNLLTLNGHTLPICEWAELLGINPHILSQRYQTGLCVDAILDCRPRHWNKGAKGSKNINAKLSVDTVLVIYNSTESYMTLAKTYNVTKGAVAAIKQRRTWKHLTGEN